MKMESLKRSSQVVSTDVATKQYTVRPTYLRDGKQAGATFSTALWAGRVSHVSGEWETFLCELYIGRSQ